MQSRSLIANSFYGSWAHLCHHMQKEKKIPIKKKKFLPALPPKLTPTETVAKVFRAGAEHRAGTYPGGFLQREPGKVRGPGGAGVRGPVEPDCREEASANYQQFLCPPASLSAPGLCTCHRPCSGCTCCAFPATSVVLCAGLWSGTWHGGGIAQC